jgi:hypothetical protein
MKLMTGRYQGIFGFRVYEVLVFFNLVFYWLLRSFVNFHGFNWFGVKILVYMFFPGLFFISFGVWAYMGFQLIRFNNRGMPLSKAIPFREYAVILLLFFSYWSLAGVSGQDRADLIHFVTKGNYAGLLIWMDDRLLGFQPSQALEAYINPSITIFMGYAYILGYTPLFILLVFVLHLRRRRDDLDRLLTAFVLAYTIAIPVFFVIPAPEPRYVLHYTQTLLDGGMFVQRLDEMAVNLDSTQMNALPSLHVALSTLVLFASRNLRRHERLAVGFLVFSLWVSTLYLRHHYFVDVLGGWLLALLTWHLSRGICSWDSRRQS